MFGRGLLGKILTGGLLVAIGYLLMPRQKRKQQNLLNFGRNTLSRRNLRRMGRGLMRQFAR
ncbi:hypothetical protein [Brevibacillus massiliensis]|jgi:hypothetical protein|uniref:hypothetical protein n=1 Tax=Brevibacillus massiliensis TaxID=1118054 RepID=UPI00036B601D|nr:hypothetical protein [Brevibacillus massiliensis]